MHFMSAVKHATRWMAIPLGLLVVGLPFAALAQFSPPNRGLPGRREGGGTRGCWLSEAEDMAITPLTALVPQQNFGTTVSERPTLFVYVPPVYAEQAKLAELVVTDADGNEIYQSTYRPSTVSGLVRLSFEGSDNVPALEVGKDYNWSFALVCDQTDRSADVVVESWIQRIEPSETLKGELQTALPAQQVDVLARAGLWYDALAQLADLDSASSASQWRLLLEAVDLESLLPLIAPDQEPTDTP